MAPCNLYLATALIQGESEWMEDERIETRWFPSGEIDDLIQSGKMNDGKTLIGFLAWKRYHCK